MSLNGLPVVAAPVRPKTSEPGTQPGLPVLSERQAKYFVSDPRHDRSGRRRNGSRRGSGGLADAIYKTLRELGLGSGASGVVNPELSDQLRNDVGHLMQILFQAVQSHASTLTHGDASSFAAALASVTSQLSTDDSLQLALARVLQSLHRTQSGGRPGAAAPSPQDLLTALQRNLSVQTTAVHAKGNVVNSRA